MLSWACWASAFAEQGKRIVILSKSGDGPHQAVMSSFKNQFAGNSNIELTQLSLTPEETSNEAALNRAKPDLIFSLGQEETEWASRQYAQTPIVATMVLKDEVFKIAGNITGVSLGYPLKTQFQWLKKFFPQQKTVAILYDPKENSATVESAQHISRQTGLSLIAIPVTTPKELPFALERLANNVEILLAIPDETVMSASTIKEVLLASFRNKVPLVGLSDNWVKSGAFYALSWDYDDLGKQCASMAQKLLKGANLTAVPPELPRKITYTVNAKIADHMNMEIPEDILKNAKMVFN